MKSETTLEIINELIGRIEPCGDTKIDEIRYENQEKLIDLVIYGIEALIENSNYIYRQKPSMWKIGNRAYRTLEEISKMIHCVNN